MLKTWCFLLGRNTIKTLPVFSLKPLYYVHDCGLGCGFCFAAKLRFFSRESMFFRNTIYDSCIIVWVRPNISLFLMVHHQKTMIWGGGGGISYIAFGRKFTSHHFQDIGFEIEELPQCHPNTSFPPTTDFYTILHYGTLFYTMIHYFTL